MSGSFAEARASLPPFDPGDPQACEAELRQTLLRRLQNGLSLQAAFACVENKVDLHVVGNASTLSYRLDVQQRSVVPLEPGTSGIGSPPSSSRR